MERIQLTKLAVVLGAPVLILGVVDQTVNRLFFKVYGPKASTSGSLRLANCVTKIVLGTVIMGVASHLIPSYLLSLGSSRTLFHLVWSTTLVYAAAIPGYLFYVVKEDESRAKACSRDRITPGDFYKNKSEFELAAGFLARMPKSLNLSPGPYREISSLGPDYRTLVVWSELSKKINTQYECFYNSENPKKYDTISDQFNEWIYQNKLSLQNVQELDLNNVDFTKLALRLDQFPQLKSLNLKSSKNVEHFLSKTPPSLNQLKTIDLTSTGLTTFPSSLVSQCPCLEQLDISSNQITALPEANCLPQSLKTLNISNNKLATFPSPASPLPLLEKLDLSFNEITILPSLVQFPSLKALNISSNQIAALPEADCLPQSLTVLDISNNRSIRAIPDSILQMRAGCRIAVEGIFSYDIFRAFYRRILDIRMHTFSQYGVNLQGSMSDSLRMINGDLRRLSPEVSAAREAILAPSYEEAAESFEQTLLFWLTQYQEKFSQLCQTAPNRLPETCAKEKICPAFYNPLVHHGERGKLSLFLERLKTSKDYLDGGTNQIQLIRRVYRMLELAALDLRFCEILFPLLHDACSTCDDRPALVFNRVEMQIELFTAKEKDEKALAKLCIGLKRVELLQKCAEKRITQLKLPDPVEVFLFYETELRVKLELPVSTENMIFKNYAEITPAMLQEDAQQVLAKTRSPDDIQVILLEQEVWHDRMKQIHEAAFKKMEDGFGLRMQALSKDDALQEGPKVTAMQALVTEREKASQTFVAQRTAEWIAKNLSYSS